MDFNIVALEISDLIVHFDYYDSLVSETLNITADTLDEQRKMRDKNRERLNQLFAGTEIYDQQKQLLPLSVMKGVITVRLQGKKAKEIHELVEKLEKDAKKMKKLYKSLVAR